MSNLRTVLLACPRCSASERRAIFDSLNGDAVPAQLAAILDGSFEVATCARCGHRHQLEHPMLLSHFRRGAWIVMYPPPERPRHSTLAIEVREVFQREFAGAPPALAAMLRAVRPRLVFGQHMLAEAVRCAVEGVDPALLECAKLLALREDLARLLAWGPCELCFQGFTEDSATLVYAVHSVATGEQIDRARSSREFLAEAAAERAAFERSHPELFEGPYISVSRYLY